jgi:hypothetical protein
MKRYSYMLAAAIFFWGMGFAADLYANTVNLNPTADTWVSKLAPDTAFGSDTKIASSLESNLPLAYALLRFDASSILSGQTIQSAVLHLYQFGGAGTGDLPTILYYYANNSWVESTFTWSNMTQQTYYEERLDSSRNNDGQSHRGDSTWSFEWNPTWGSVISLIIAEYSSGEQSHNWYSREYGTQGFVPYLEITTTAVPIPAAVWLLGSGLLGLIGIRRFRK